MSVKKGHGTEHCATYYVLCVLLDSKQCLAQNTPRMVLKRIYIRSLDEGEEEESELMQ